MKPEVKKILWIVGGAAVLIWFIVQRNTPAPYPSPQSSRQSRSSIADEMSGGLDASVGTGASPVSQEQTERFERYPMMEAPAAVAPEQEFLVRVSLTERQFTRDVQILDGEAGNGKIGFSLPTSAENSWPIEVDLMADGLDFTRGSTPYSAIVLPLKGNATVATFYVKAGAKAAAQGVVPMLVSFYYHGELLAHIQRDIQIKGSTPAPNAEPPPAVRTMKDSGAIPNTPAAFKHPPTAPDLTVSIMDNKVEVNSPYFAHPDQGDMPKMTGFADFLAECAPVSTGRGAKRIEGESHHDCGADTFGQKLYDRYAPEIFKQAFWMLFDGQGANFRSIQIYSDKPDIPWEYMQPRRENGGDRQPFLGVTYSIARWEMNKGLRDHPPFTEIMEKTFVIAPNYSDTRKLPSEITEVQELAKLDGYTPVNGNMNAMKNFFSKSPRGIVHFAGHGELNQTHTNYEILLEDGALDTDNWRSMAKDDPGSQTFFFFNACDVGQANLEENFVDGWGPAVLDKGASGYIGALFPVDDQVAASFSVYFYKLLHEQMKQGPADVSDILEQTRRDVYKSTHNNPTALAYVLYGHTDLKFVTGR